MGELLLLIALLLRLGPTRFCSDINVQQCISCDKHVKSDVPVLRAAGRRGFADQTTDRRHSVAASAGHVRSADGRNQLARTRCRQSALAVTLPAGTRITPGSTLPFIPRRP